MILKILCRDQWNPSRHVKFPKIHLSMCVYYVFILRYPFGLDGLIVSPAEDQVTGFPYNFGLLFT